LLLSPQTIRWVDLMVVCLSTKIHTLTDQRACPVTVILTGRHSGDNPLLVPLLDLHRRQQRNKPPGSCPRAGR